jgi:hypothetical protein
MMIVLWIALVLSALGALGGLMLAYIGLRWGTRSDRKMGVAIGAFAIGQVGIPIGAFRLAAGGHHVGAVVLGSIWGLISLSFLLMWPALVSAAAQP